MKLNIFVALMVALSVFITVVHCEDVPVETHIDDAEADEIDEETREDRDLEIDEETREDRDLEIVVDDDENMDIAEMFKVLFDSDDSDVTVRDGRSTDVEEKSSKFNPSVIAKYNTFIDTFIRRMSSTMGQYSDPMNVRIKNGKVSGMRKSKGKNNKKKNNNRGKNAKRRRKNSNKKSRGNKRGRHPKDLSIDDQLIEVDDEQHEDEQVENESESRVKRDLTDENEEEDEHDEAIEESKDGDQVIESSARESRDLFNEEQVAEEEVEEGVEEGVEEKSSPRVNRKGVARGGKRKRRPNNKRRKQSGKTGQKGKKGKKGRKGNKGKKGKRGTKGKRGKKRNGMGDSTAILTGISSIRRSGDVIIVEKGNIQLIRASILVGPVILKAQTSVRYGLVKENLKAEAMAPEVKGTLVISITGSGQARVKTLRLFKPKAVSVLGSLSKRSKVSDRLMQNYIGKANSLVSRKMTSIARKILKVSRNDKKKNKRKNKKGKRN